MRHRKDLALYRLSERDGKPRYEYQGPSFTPPVDRERLPWVKAALLLGAAMLAGLVFLMGRLDFPSLRTLYVTLPFLLVVFGAGWSLTAAVSLFFWKEKMTVREHRVSWNALAASGLASAIGAAALAAAAAIHVALGGSLEREWPLLALCLGALCTAFAIFLYIKRHPCRAEPFPSAAPTASQERIRDDS